VETSLALHAFPDLVKQDIAPGLEPNFDYDVEAFRGETKDYWGLSNGSGYFGSPQSASAETGKKVVAIRRCNIAQVILMPGGQQSKEIFNRFSANSDRRTNRLNGDGAKRLQTRSFIVGFHALFSILMLCIV
jgi:hypothetical protein